LIDYLIVYFIRSKGVYPAEVVDDLMNALAKLYSYDGQYEKTLAIYLQRRNQNAFRLIQTHNLFDKIGTFPFSMINRYFSFLVFHFFFIYLNDNNYFSILFQVTIKFFKNILF
jgi:hypothetical protein